MGDIPTWFSPNRWNRLGLRKKRQGSIGDGPIPIEMPPFNPLVLVELPKNAGELHSIALGPIERFTAMDGMELDTWKRFIDRFKYTHSSRSKNHSYQRLLLHPYGKKITAPDELPKIVSEPLFPVGQYSAVGANFANAVPERLIFINLKPMDLLLFDQDHRSRCRCCRSI